MSNSHSKGLEERLMKSVREAILQKALKTTRIQKRVESEEEKRKEEGES
jgi:hypothetical protein